MEWVSTRVDASSTGPMMAFVEWLDPSGEFMQAIGLSAANQLLMPIPNGPVGFSQSGYVQEYSWVHEDLPFAYLGPTPKRVRLTVIFVVVP